MNHKVTETNTMSREAAISAFRLLAAIARRKKKEKRSMERFGKAQ
ncbi:hypothetical protein [Cohnella massiliensis]|nr:hypothetical protein [Cohnella massiliensis]